MCHDFSIVFVVLAIALLEEIGIIEKQKNRGNGQDRTWQYKLNFDVLNRLLEHGKCKTEHSRFHAEQYHRSHPEASKPQQHSAVELEKSEPLAILAVPVDCKVANPLGEEVKTEILDCAEEPKQTGIVDYALELEQPQISRFVDEQEQDYSTTETDTHEDHSSAAPVVSNFCDEDSGDDSAFEPVEKSIQPSNQEVQEVLQQLREIPCTPQFRLNAEIQRTVKRYWENLPGT
ncbi:MAG: hypothetical protein KME32_26035 [Mojavia pulchra JT2-VF2]|uniref:Uncharacterized protein n=1 Tax=Mojavia pulchra JT2-VF2 TaxID=287848 RepID=A0A951UJN4_9NOST|nr:hypothetical protein [Mojavia pulchra JT2-VF2]